MVEELKVYYFKDILEKEYGKDVTLASRDANVSVQQIRNWNSQNREFYRLADGRYILKTVRTTIFTPKIDLEITGYQDQTSFFILDFIEKIFFNSRKAAAFAAGIGIFQLNNMISQHPDKEIVKAENGQFFALHSKNKILNMKDVKPK